ncbi:hypothetical protein R3P38DRAFT_1513258 [Favolaschia claudopus]|uniref:Uncharacterized protein n=1 Tax=Favolaschia claudopus TaxID=2862362 RepID=A0AAW0AJU4_9AGAR
MQNIIGAPQSPSSEPQTRLRHAHCNFSYSRVPVVIHNKFLNNPCRIRLANISRCWRSFLTRTAIFLSDLSVPLFFSISRNGEATYLCTSEGSRRPRNEAAVRLRFIIVSPRCSREAPMSVFLAKPRTYCISNGKYSASVSREEFLVAPVLTISAAALPSVSRQRLSKFSFIRQLNSDKLNAPGPRLHRQAASPEHSLPTLHRGLKTATPLRCDLLHRAILPSNHIIACIFQAFIPLRRRRPCPRVYQPI